MAHLKHTFSQP